MTDLDLIYQDGLRLSELYGQMETIQYDMAHITMSTIGYTIVACVILAMMYFFFMAVWLDHLKDDVFRYDRRTRPEDGPWIWNRRGKYAYTLIVIGVFVLFAIICVGIQIGFEHIMEYCLSRDMVGVQAQIDAIETRLGIN